MHLLPQQLSVEEGGLTQVLVRRASSEAVGHIPWPCCPFSEGHSPHLAELGAQSLGLGGVRPRQAGPQLLDVAEA